MPDTQPDIQAEIQSEIREEKNVYEWFWWSVVLKGVISAAEIVAGIVVYAIPPSLVLGLTNWLLRSEISENPTIATLISSASHGFTGALQLFIAIYLFSRGFIKLILVIALLRNKLWAYPASLVVLGLFVVYQVYQIIISHSLVITGITLFDLVVIYFVWREYRIVEAHLHSKQPITTSPNAG